MPKLDIAFGEIYKDEEFCRADVLLNGEFIGTISHEYHAWPEFRGWHFLGKEIYYDLDDSTGLSKMRFMRLPFSDSTLKRRWREHRKTSAFKKQRMDWKNCGLPWQPEMDPR